MYDWQSLPNSSVTIEEDVMGGACGTYGDEGKIVHDSGGEKPECKDHPENLGVDGRIILKCI